MGLQHALVQTPSSQLPDRHALGLLQELPSSFLGKQFPCEMGLGKSLQALCVVAALDAWPCLAVVPAVTRRGWAEEAELHLGA